MDGLKRGCLRRTVSLQASELHPPFTPLVGLVELLRDLHGPIEGGRHEVGGYERL